MRVADVVVVGAGILGAAVAHELATAGLKVVVLERGSPNREGSGTTAGNLHIQAIHTRRPGQLVPVDNVRFLPLQVAASRLWSRVEEEVDADIELRRHGGFMVAETAEEERELHEKRRHEHRHGIPGEMLDAADAHDALPLLGPTVRAACWCPWDGYANPLLITPAWLRSASRKGAEIRPFQPVTGLRRDRSGWVISTPGDAWSAGTVIDVAGPWIAHVAALAGAHVRMSPVAIQMHVTVRVPPTMQHLVQHIARGLSVKQVTAGQILIGGGWPAADLDLNGRSPESVTSMMGNLREATRILPFLADVQLLRTWAGPLAATPDEMPVIGEVPEHPGLYIAGGTYAFTFAPLWGKVLCGMVRGDRPYIDTSDLGVDRLYGPARADGVAGLRTLDHSTTEDASPRR